MKNIRFKKIMLFLVFTFLSITKVFAYITPEKDIPIDILVNGHFIKTDAQAFIEYDTTYAPIRIVSEALGAEKILWDENSSKATIQRGNDTIIIYENKTEAYVNNKKVILTKNAKIKSGRLFVPLRFVAEAFGASVSWDEEYYNVVIEQPDTQIESALVSKLYTNDEVKWLARVIHAESEGEPFIGKIGVGNVVLNRVKSKDFPGTIYEVIFDTKDGIQFEPVINGKIYNNPSQESVISAKRALRGENTVGESLYFYNPKIASSSWIKNNRTYYTTINNHDFYL